MSTPTTASAPRPAPTQRNASLSLLLMLGGIIAYGGYSEYLAWQTGLWQMRVVAAAVGGFGVLTLVGLWLVRRGRITAGVALTVVAFLATDLTISVLLRGLGLSMLFIAPLLSYAVMSRNVSARATWVLVAVSIAAGLAMLAADVYTPGAFRALAPSMQIFTPAVAALLAVAYVVTLLRMLADYSLRAKLIIGFLVVALVPLAVLAVIDNRASQQVLTDTANKALLGVSSQTADALDAFINNTRSVVLTESQEPALRLLLAVPPAKRSGSDQASLVTLLLPTWQARDARVRSYALLDLNGNVVASTLVADAGRTYGQAPFFLQALAAREPVVSDVLFEPRAATGDLYFSAVVLGARRIPAGVLVARFDAAALQDIVQRTNGLAGTDSFGVLFDDNLMHLAHGTRPEERFTLERAAGPEEIAALQAQGRLPTLAGADFSADMPGLADGLAAASGGATFSLQDPGAGGRVSQVAVAQMRTRPWRVLFFQPRDVFLAPIEGQTRSALVLAAIIALVAAGAALLAAQVLVEPLHRLTAAAQKVSAGDLSVQAPVDSGDEIGALARTFNGMTARLSETVSSLEQRVAERTAQLQAAADISRATASVRDLDELLRLALELIRQRFGFYHASIFLVDAEQQVALLRESTGPVGAQLKARGHKLAIGSKSLIGWVTQVRQPRVALDVGEDPFYFSNPLLPGTRSELAIPLQAGDRLLGALDVQSTAPNAFGPGDVQVLQTVADQLSVAIENAQLFSQTQASLRELSQLYQRVTSTSWRSLLRGRRPVKVYEAIPSDPAAAAADDGAPPLVVPLVLRDQQVGAIELHGRRPEEWASDERAALDTVAAQLAAALESAALLDETQRRRMQEQLVNQITQQMRATLDPTHVIQSGLRELGRALGATEVVVRLAPGAAGPAVGGPEADR